MRTTSSIGRYRSGPQACGVRTVLNPYVHHVTDTWTTTAKVPARLLGVPPSLATPALPHLGASPLAPLFHHHMAEVRQVASHVDGLAAASLGSATLALARALVASVSGHDRLGREAMDDILLLRVKTYVRAHLTDVDLDPHTIAAANHVSTRQLYKICRRRTSSSNSGSSPNGSHTHTRNSLAPPRRVSRSPRSPTDGASSTPHTLPAGSARPMASHLANGRC